MSKKVLGYYKTPRVVPARILSYILSYADIYRMNATRVLNFSLDSREEALTMYGAQPIVVRYEHEPTYGTKSRPVKKEARQIS
jgi:hypothetical protein